MDKQIEKIDTQKTYFKIFNIVCIGVLLTLSILFMFSNMLPMWFETVMFWFILLLFLTFLILDIVFYAKIKKNIKNVLKSKYMFDRTKTLENIKTKYTDCIMQEVEFLENCFILNGDKVPYDEVNLEYSVYGDNIMFHIYVKGEETSPLLVFIVTEEMYYMIREFNLNLSKLNSEIEALNMNYKK